MPEVDPSFPHIAVCIDRSPSVARSIAAAQRLRSLTPGRLTLVHVATAEPLTGYSRWGVERQLFHRRAREWLDGLARRVPGAETELLWGHPAESVIEWAWEVRPDVLVAASHAGRVEQVLGSFVRRIVLDAPCAVLVLPPGVDAAAAGGFGHIACCIDDSPASERATLLAQQIRRLSPGRLSIVHALPPEPSPESAVLDWAEVVEPDLIVAAAHRSRLERTLHGSFAARIARDAPCPVLVTR
jgi:nucleotide-binding universal stress UspA family protein